MPQTAHAHLGCGFAEVDAVLEDCVLAAQALLSDRGLRDYGAAALQLGKMGRGAEPLLIFLQSWPQTAQSVGEAALPPVLDTVRAINKSPNGRAIAPFLQSLPAVARRLPTLAQLQQYLELSQQVLQRTSGSIHGVHLTYASPCLVTFFEQAPALLQLLSLAGLRAWAAYGMQHYAQHPEQQRQYFALQLADSRAVLQRERHGTLLVDQMRKLDLYLCALWQDALPLVPYSTALFADAAAPLQPYWDALGMRLPDVLEDAQGISGLDRYRAAVAHMAAHRRWSRAIVADNYSPAQRLAIECFEDARVDCLAQRSYPGLGHILRALQPAPQACACNEQTHSCLRHRLALLSRALLCSGLTQGQAQVAKTTTTPLSLQAPDRGEHEHEPAHANENVGVDRDHATPDGVPWEFVARFQAELQQGESSTAAMAALAIAYLARTRRQSDQQARTWFADAPSDYRDDNRHLWTFLEAGDEEESFDAPPQRQDTQQLQSLPPRHYPEWDYRSQSYRPDWVSLYEGLHPSGQASAIDELLAQHGALLKRLKRMLDLLKPHARVRLRHQEDGSELELDAALRALIDLKALGQPDTRITESQQSSGRSIAVTLLLDLSESLNARVPGSSQSVLQLSQEAVALLAWTVEQLGDPLAIAGFHSNSRHDVRYLHLKGFGEHWGDAVKARLAAMQAGYSTRMGAAMRHAAHTLAAQKADTRLLLVLTDGQPWDVDVNDEALLIQDARQSVKELAAQGITSYCVSLDARADSYVRPIFGKQYTVLDQIASLPEKLPRLFMKLTH